MANAYGVLGQSNPVSLQDTTLYTVPLTYEAIVSSLFICNLNTACTIRVAVIPDGDTLSNENYILYNTALAANETLTFTSGISLSSQDSVSVYTDSPDVAFTMFGVEIIPSA